MRPRLGILSLVMGVWTTLGLTAGPTANADDDDDDDDDGIVLIVDKDLVQCPDADFQSIQAAVNAAPTGATILVCPDTYNEQVTVSKTLTLKATGGSNGDDDDDDDDGDDGDDGDDDGDDDDDAPWNCFQHSTPDPTRHAIVQGATFSFNLMANDIVVDGFVVRSPSAPIRNFAGIRLDAGFSGYRVQNNLIEHHILDIIVNSNGQRRTYIQDNCLRNSDTGIELSTFFLAAPGIFSNGFIDGNSFANHDFRGVFFSRPSNDVTISDNVSRNDDQHFIQMFRSVNNRIVGNDIAGSFFAGIELVDANNGLLISGNRIRDSRWGVQFWNFGGGTNFNVTVLGNDARRLGEDGIVVRGFSLINSRLKVNRTFDNSRDGIRIEVGGNGGNLILSNTAQGNGEHDCHDDTVGTGTAGTANTWIDNEGDTENRPGLCEDDEDDEDD